jgi:hypothetical protein
MATSTQSKAQLLREKSHAFCHALISPPPPEELIKAYFTKDSPKIIEYGPAWCRARLPFLHTTFNGARGEDSCQTYFEILSKILKMHLSEGAFPRPEGFIVDPDAVVEGCKSKGAVSVTGKGKFESVQTGKSYNEVFSYRLSDFDDDGKIGRWEIWSDSLSAWDAVGFDEH